MLISSPKRYMCSHKSSKLCPECSWMIMLWPNGVLWKTWDSLHSAVSQSCICSRELLGDVGRVLSFCWSWENPTLLLPGLWSSQQSCHISKGVGLPRVEPNRVGQSGPVHLLREMTKERSSCANQSQDEPTPTWDHKKGRVDPGRT